MQKTKKRLNAPPHLFGQTIPFCQGTFEKIFYFSVIKTAFGLFQKLIKICLSTYLEQGSLKFNPNT